MKTALVNCPDTGPLESLAIMLREAGYECVLPGPQVVADLKALGCDTVLSVDHLVKNWGYDPPLDPATGKRFETLLGTKPLDETVDLYVDVKAHRNGPRVWARHPTLKGKTLWYRINGGEPEHVVKDGVSLGDEVNPPCPVLTPNRWYGDGFVYTTKESAKVWETKVPCPSYSCWPPFARIADYSFPRKSPGRGAGRKGGYEAPICLVHNVRGWGYQDLVDPVRELGVRVHGVGSPDGLLQHREVGIQLGNALAYVHLKSNDAPGYALYEALAAGCPVIIPKRLIWRCRMQELFVGGRTCLTFDRETHDPLSPEDVRTCTEEIEAQLTSLANVDFNQKVGEAGRERLKEVMWRADRDGDSFREFMRRNFGG